MLVHYEVNLPLRLACDASAYGVGTVISHVMTNNDKKPIVYASRSLTKSEKNYSQIEKEALSIIFEIPSVSCTAENLRYVLTDHKQFWGLRQSYRH